MIYLIYGPDSVSAGSFLSSFKKNYSDHSLISGKKQKASTLSLPLEENLFGGKKLIIIEDFTPKESEPLGRSESIDIVIVNEDLTTVPSWIDKSWVFKQSESLTNFKLADQVVDGQKRLAILTLTKLLKQKTAPEIIIGSLVRQFRLLSLSLYGETEVISKSPFVKERTQEQAKNWNLGKIKKALLLILKTDLAIKTGNLNTETALVLLVDKLTSISN